MGTVIAYWLDYASIRSLSGGVGPQSSIPYFSWLIQLQGSLAIPSWLPDHLRFDHTRDPTLSARYSEVNYYSKILHQRLTSEDGCTRMEEKRKLLRYLQV